MPRDLIVEAAANKYGLDPNLLHAMFTTESSNNNSAVSPKGARGYGQLMPGTAKEMGVSDINDPIQNIMGSAKYLKQNLDKFGGSKELALAAYNAGPNAVIAHKGIPPFPETQHHVSRVMNIFNSLNPISNAQASEEPYQPKDLLEGIDPKIIASQPKDLFPNEERPSIANQVGNSTAKAISGVIDTVINAPNNANNLMGAAVGILMSTAGIDPQYWPQVKDNPDVARKLFEAAGVIKQQYDPQTAEGRLADYVYQSALGAAIMPGSALKNAAVGAGAGVAGGLTQEVTGSPLAGIAASIAVPVAGMKAAGAISRIPNKFSEAGSSESAARRIEAGAGVPRDKLIADIEASPEHIPNSNRTTAQASRNTGLAGMQRLFETNPGNIDTNTSISDAFAERYAKQQAAQVAHINKAIPVQNGGDAFNSNINAEVAGLKSAMDDKSAAALAETGERVYPEQAGKVVGDIIAARHKAAKSATGAAYRAIDPENISQVPVPHAAIKAVIEREFLPGNVPADLNKLLTTAETTGKAPVTLEVIRKLRTEAGSIAQKYGASGEKNLARVAKDIKRILDEVPDNAADMGVIPSDMANRVRAARAARIKQGLEFETGAVNNLNKSSTNNTPKLEDAQIMKNFINGSPDDIKSLMVAIDGNPKALKAANDYIKTQFDDAIYSADGALKSNFGKNYGEFNKRYRPVLNEFPELRKKIDAAAKAISQAERTKTSVATGGARHFTAGKDASKAIDSLLSSGTKQSDTASLLSLIQSKPLLKQQLAGGIKDKVLNDVVKMGADDALGNQTFNAGKALKTLKEPKNVRLLNELLDPAQQNALKKFKLALEDAQFSKNEGRMSGSDTAQKLSIDQAVSGSARLLGKSSGLVSSLVKILSSIGDERVQAKVAKMLIEPDFAVNLLKSTARPKQKTLAQLLKNSALVGQTIPHIKEKTNGIR